MLRLEDSHGIQTRASSLVSDIQTPGGRLALRCTEPDARSRLLACILAELEEPVLVYVPDAMDQTERVILEIATALGDRVPQRVDDALRGEAEEPRAALEILDGVLCDRPLVVDGWDRLGFSAADRELGLTLRDRSRALQQWLQDRGTLFTLGRGRSPNGVPEERWRLDQTDEAPITLTNGVEQPLDLWDRFAPDARVYELALATIALGSTPDDPAIESATDHGLRVRIVELLPDSLCRLLRMLAIHGRPVSEALLGRRAGISAEAVALGADLGLWRRLPTGLIADTAWSRWWRGRLGGTPRRAAHRELAELFAAEAYPDDPGAGRAGLALLEAHRHFLSAGEIEKAHAYARHGVALLVEAARALSINGNHLDAARLYERVVLAADEQRLPVGKKLQGYARHYLHYNRAHASAEDLKATERGFRRALDDWPENALFWSRLVRTLFYDDRPAEAMSELSRAQQRVPAHPRKQTVLVARTVRGLLRDGRDRVLDAIFTWGSYRPDTVQAREVEVRLTTRLGSGWSCRRLALLSETPLFFTWRQEIRIVGLSSRWIAEFPALQVAAAGASPLEALGALLERVREETRALIRAHTADLAPDRRLRKQRLLGAIDVAASCLDAPGADAVWVFGDLRRREDGRVCLHTGGSYDLSFEIPGEMAADLTVGELPCFALVEATRGMPTGPVTRLETGIRRRSEDLWEEWRRRLARAG